MDTQFSFEGISGGLSRHDRYFLQTMNMAYFNGFPVSGQCQFADGVPVMKIMQSSVPPSMDGLFPFNEKNCHLL